MSYQFFQKYYYYTNQVYIWIGQKLQVKSAVTARMNKRLSTVAVLSPETNYKENITA